MPTIYTKGSPEEQYPRYRFNAGRWEADYPWYHTQGIDTVTAWRPSTMLANKDETTGRKSLLGINYKSTVSA